MRYYWLALLGLLAVGAGAFAQQAPPQATTGTPEQLNAHLARWEKEMAAVQSFSSTCTRTDVNKVRNSNTQLSGVVKFLKVDAGGGKVDKLALLSLVPTAKGDQGYFEKFICTGDLLYQFSPSEKTIWIYKMNGGIAADSLVNMLFEMKADALKKRYDMTLTYPTGKEDANYIYIDIKPKHERDKVEFERARVVLYKANYLPCQLWFQEANGDYHTWGLSEVKANEKIDRTEFVSPEKPKGWEMKEAKRSQADAKPGDGEPKPRVIRGEGQK
jgi:TIGR03009 family protein